MPHLTDSGREALRLAYDLQKAVEQTSTATAVPAAASAEPQNVAWGRLDGRVTKALGPPGSTRTRAETGPWA